MEEKWVSIKWYEWKYEISNLWRVKSLNYLRTKKEKILVTLKSKRWYCQVHLSRDSKPKTQYIHRLVMNNFRGSSNMQVNHIDWDKCNNRIENLEYCTNSENAFHRDYLLPILKVQR